MTNFKIVIDFQTWRLLRKWLRNWVTIWTTFPLTIGVIWKGISLFSLWVFIKNMKGVTHSFWTEPREQTKAFFKTHIYERKFHHFFGEKILLCCGASSSFCTTKSTGVCFCVQSPWAMRTSWLGSKFMFNQNVSKISFGENATPHVLIASSFRVPEQFPNYRKFWFHIDIDGI